MGGTRHGDAGSGQMNGIGRVVRGVDESHNTAGIASARDVARTTDVVTGVHLIGQVTARDRTRCRGIGDGTQIRCAHLATHVQLAQYGSVAHRQAVQGLGVGAAIQVTDKAQVRGVLADA